MRTGVYVYGDKVSFALRDDLERMVRFVNPDGDTVIQVIDGAVTLDRGIYKVVTDEPAELRVVSGTRGDADVVVVTDNKDPWPDPPAKFAQIFSDVAPASLRKFLPTSGGVGDASTRPPQANGKPATKAGRAAKRTAKPASRR